MLGRKRTLIVIALAGVQIMLGSAVLGYRWVSDSTAVTAQEALERFRSSEGAGRTLPRGLPEGPILTPSPPPTPSPTATPASRRRSRSTPTPPPRPVIKAPPAYPQTPPEAGVYSFDTVGWEEGAGIRRDLPRTSQRIVRVGGPRTWDNEHIYSDEHVERFDITVTEQGLFNSYNDGEVTFGPFTGQQRLEISPPMRLAIVPFRLGQRWQGDWTGSTSGSYVGSTVEHTKIRVAGEDVEVWAVSLDMTFSGDLAGTVRSKVWISPKYRMTIKETYDQRFSTDRGSYRGVWTITLLDPRPRK